MRNCATSWLATFGHLFCPSSPTLLLLTAPLLSISLSLSSINKLTCGPPFSWLQESVLCIVIGNGLWDCWGRGFGATGIAARARQQQRWRQEGNSMEICHIYNEMIVDADATGGPIDGITESGIVDVVVMTVEKKKGFKMDSSDTI